MEKENKWVMGLNGEGGWVEDPPTIKGLVKNYMEERFAANQKVGLSPDEISF